MPLPDRPRDARRALLRRSGKLALLAMGLPAALRAAAAASPARETPELARFSESAAGLAPPPPWQAQDLRKVPPNRHALVDGGGRTVLEIDSSASASSLLHPVGKEFAGARRLRWRWKTDGYPMSGRFGEKSGDDYAARVYLLFDYPVERVPLAQRLLLRAGRSLHGEDLPAATLCYLLDPRAPAETLLESPYTSRVRMIVVRSSPRTGTWWEEERDLAADFQRAFGAEHGPGVPALRGIAVAADTDQSGARLRTRFGDLELR